MDIHQAQKILQTARGDVAHANDIVTAALTDCESVIEDLLEVIAQQHESLEELGRKVEDLESRIAELEADE